MKKQFSQIIKLKRILTGILFGSYIFRLLLRSSKKIIVFSILKHLHNCRITASSDNQFKFNQLDSVPLTKLSSFYTGNEACSERMP